MSWKPFHFACRACQSRVFPNVCSKILGFEDYFKEANNFTASNFHMHMLNGGRQGDMENGTFYCMVMPTNLLRPSLRALRGLKSSPNIIISFTHHKIGSQFAFNA